MRKWILCLVLAGSVVGVYAQQAERHRLIKRRVILPMGWVLTPAGHNLPLGDLPRHMAASPGGKYLAVSKSGVEGETLQLIDAGREKILDNVRIPGSRPGLVFSADEKSLYASAGKRNEILQFAIVHNKLVFSGSIALGGKTGEKMGLAGLAIDDKGQLLYAVTRESQQLYVIDLSTKTVLQRVDLGGRGYACVLSNKGDRLYITCQGCNKLEVFDVKARKLVSEIPLGDNPGDLCLSRDDRFLFAANINDHSVSIIDLTQGKTLQTIDVALYPGAPGLAATNAMAIGGDGNTLYIANGDHNCISVVDISHPGSDPARPKGFIPVGWYPTALKLAGDKIFVANGKGFSSLSADPGTVAAADGSDAVDSIAPIPYHNASREHNKKTDYIAGLFTGSLSVLREPNEKLLEIYSGLVYQNCPYIRIERRVTKN